MKKFHFFGLSLLAHLFVLTVFFLHFSPKNKEVSLTAMPSYVQITQTTNKTALIKQPAIQKKLSENHFSSTITTPHKESLLTLLHDLIAARQEYPASALALEQTGRVKVSFLLAANGAVSDINLMESSGVASLDHAAVAAVQAISPVAEARDYLNHSELLTLDVVFES